MVAGLSRVVGQEEKKKRDVTFGVTLFRVLPRATSEGPILPCPRCPRPIYIIIFPSLSCVTPLASPLPLSTIYREHPS
jgi:hypothetical protein